MTLEATTIRTLNALGNIGDTKMPTLLVNVSGEVEVPVQQSRTEGVVLEVVGLVDIGLVSEQQVNELLSVLRTRQVQGASPVIVTVKCKGNQ